MRVATAQYPIERHGDWSGYAGKLRRWVAEAAGQGCELLLFPEYGSMELASLLGEDVQQDVVRQRREMQGFLDRFRALHAELARAHRVWISAASIPVAQPDGSVRNRVHVYGPGGEVGHQDKLIMTRFERESWFIDAGHEACVFDTGATVVGIAICYDVEFPLLARRLVEAGARVLLVPSCTDTEAGFHRVRVGAQARALENQCFAVHAVTWGEAPWSAAVDVNTGCASVYTPIDRGFPASGILAAQPADRPGWLVVDLDLDAVEAVRRDGQVTNDRDWPLHVAAAATPVGRRGG
jgi:predicted amidohydrolase